MDNVYYYPGKAVLKNKLGIQERDRLLTAEIRLVAVRLYQLHQESPIQGDFGFNHLCRIHYHIFQDLYPWAGGCIPEVHQTIA